VTLYSIIQLGELIFSSRRAKNEDKVREPLEKIRNKLERAEKILDELKE